MKSSLTAVRSAFKTAITALGYAVYDRQRKVNDYPYIVIGEQTEVQNGDQGEFGQEATINIEVYNGWASDYGERTTSDNIIDDIMLWTVTKPHTLTIEYFDMPVLTVDNVMSATEQTPTHTIVTTVIRFKMQLFEVPYTLITDEAGKAIVTDTNQYLIID